MNFFDIDWEHDYENIKGRVLAPFLGTFYGESLESGEITLHYGREGLTIRYYDMVFPVSLGSYSDFFSYGLAGLKKTMGAEHPDFIKLLGVLYVLRSPVAEEDDEDHYHQVKFIKRMLWDLYRANADFMTYVSRNLLSFNGERGNPDSFALLDDLLSKQLFRLSFWKIATKEINYRRFFNINDLISLRVEDESVLTHTHRLVFDLLQSGKIAGLRIDHVDGLYDPTRYLEQARAQDPEYYLIVEKILGLDEDLPENWPVQGTTGYDFAAYVNGIFCERKNDRTFKRIYSEFTGSKAKFDDLLLEKKKLIIIEHMAGDVNNLVQIVKTLSSRDRHGADATQYGLRRALTEVLAAFPVYRTYINSETPSENDRRYIEAALDRAIAANPGLLHELRFIRRFLLMEFPQYLDEQRKADWLKVTMRFQQMTGPLMAKGLEDTALYVYNRLISLNEVGGRPDNFGCSVKRFHRFNRRRRRFWPHSLNATTTHDTKRGEDVRARIDVLSEIPEEWEAKLKLWKKINKGVKKRIKGLNVPDRNDEYFLYQTLLGAFPFSDSEYPEFVERIKNYIIKAVREAKIHTEWIKPDAAYEAAYISFLETLLDRLADNPFLQEFLPFQRKIAYYGMFNGLSQTLIKITSPGVPDFYQGTELWDFSFVDPDNRRSVDFEARKAALEKIRQRADSDLPGLVLDLLSHMEDGAIKLFLVAKALDARNTNAPLFRSGRYIPLETTGKFRRSVVAFARKHFSNWSVTVAPRFLSSLMEVGALPLGSQVWDDTAIVIPEGAPSEWRNVFTNERLQTGDSLTMGRALEHFPVALFVQLIGHEKATGLEETHTPR